MFPICVFLFKCSGCRALAWLPVAFGDFVLVASRLPAAQNSFQSALKLGAKIPFSGQNFADQRLQGGCVGRVQHGADGHEVFCASDDGVGPAELYPERSSEGKRSARARPLD